MDNVKLALRIPEAASALGVSRSALYALLRSGRIGYVRIGGGSKRVPVTEIQKFIAENTVRAGGTAA